jgi:hypothetical protein
VEEVIKDMTKYLEQLSDMMPAVLRRSNPEDSPRMNGSYHSGGRGGSHWNTIQAKVAMGLHATNSGPTVLDRKVSVLEKRQGALAVTMNMG